MHKHTSHIRSGILRFRRLPTAVLTVVLLHLNAGGAEAPVAVLTTRFRVECLAPIVLPGEPVALRVTALGDDGTPNPTHQGQVACTVSDPDAKIHPGTVGFSRGTAEIRDILRFATPGVQEVVLHDPEEPAVSGRAEIFVAGAGRLWYVDAAVTNDLDAPGDQPDRALPQLGRALRQARPGDTVIVAPGRYAESPVLSCGTLSRQWLTLLADTTGLWFGRPGPVVLEPATNPALTVRHSAHVNLQGFTVAGNIQHHGLVLTGSQTIRVSGCAFGPCDRAVDIRESGDVIVTGCVFAEHSIYGVRLADSVGCHVLDNRFDGADFPVVVMGGHGMMVSGNRIRNASVCAVSLQGAGAALLHNDIRKGLAQGILVDGGVADIRHNVVSDCGDAGIEAHATGGDLRIVNNTIAFNGMGIRLRDVAGSTLHQNIIAGNRTSGIEADAASAAGAVQTYNCTAAHATNWTGALTHAGFAPVLADPLFADPSADERDLHLQSAGGRLSPAGWVRDSATSPCIDAGDPRADYARESCPNGARVNLGAYGDTPEASRTPPPTVTLIVAARPAPLGRPAPCDYGSHPIAQDSIVELRLPSPFNASAGTRCEVTGWEGAGSIPAAGSSNAVQAVLADDSSITWLWTHVYEIAIAAGDGGRVDGATSGWYRAGQDVDLCAVPAEGWIFAGWEGPAAATGMTATNRVTITAPGTFRARFAPRQLTLAQYSLHGGATPATAYSYDTETLLEAPAPVVAGDQRYSVCGWRGTGSVPAAGTTATVRVCMREDSSITWCWATHHRVNVTIVGPGTVTPAVPAWVGDGQSLQLAALADAGSFGFLHWSGDILSKINPLVTTVTHPLNLVATFSDDTDADQLPDAWEQRCFGHTGVLPEGDADEDGWSNQAEYQAGSDPKRGASFPLPAPLAEAAVARVGNHVYLCGGYDGQRALTNLWRFSPDTRRFEPRAPMPLALRGHRAASCAQGFFVAGGETADGQPQIHPLRYEPQFDQWTRIAPVLQPRTRAAIAAAGHGLYLFGGTSDNRPTAAVEYLREGAGAWTPAPPLPEPCSAAHAVTAPDGAVYVAAHGPGDRGVVWRFRPGDNAFEPVTTFADDTAAAPVCLHDWGALIFPGGGIQPRDDIQCLAIQGDRWHLAGAFDGPRTAQGAFIWQERIFVLGGYDDRREPLRRAEYVALNTHPLITLASPGGRIQPGGFLSVPRHATVRLAVVPDPGHAVTNVVMDDLAIGPAPTVEIANVTNAHMLIAYFAPLGDETDVTAPMVLIPKPQPGAENLAAFFLDAREVTVADYKVFCRATERAMPPPPPWGWEQEDLPIVNVTLADAQAYARWAGKRLPTSREYAYAMRGGYAGAAYPWGDAVTRDDARYGGAQAPAAVQSFPANGYGLHDVAGNVWEWCADTVAGTATNERHVICGGSYNTAATFLRCDRQHALAADVSYADLGFRCAREVDPATLAATLAQPDDINANHLPDWWETMHFGPIARLRGQGGSHLDDAQARRVARADSDGDGHSNLDEYLAGTNPADPHSAFRVRRLQIETRERTRVTLTWPSVAGQVYTIQHAPAVTGPFVTIAENIAAAPPANTHSCLMFHGDQGFFRILIQK